jgi:replicative DNA helicase
VINRAPPYDLTAEKAVLGCVLLNSDTLNELTLILRPDDFYEDAHRILFQAMSGLYDSGKRIDIALLVNQLKTTDEFDLIGKAKSVADGVVTDGKSAAEIKRAAVIAKAIPVFPLVASMRVSPGLMSPRASAPRIMDKAGRSFTEPAGLLPSSLPSTILPRSAAMAPGKRCSRTRGVCPTAFSTVG